MPATAGEALPEKSPMGNTMRTASGNRVIMPLKSLSDHDIHNVCQFTYTIKKILYSNSNHRIYGFVQRLVCIQRKAKDVLGPTRCYFHTDIELYISDLWLQHRAMSNHSAFIDIILQQSHVMLTSSGPGASKTWKEWPSSGCSLTWAAIAASF